MYHERRRDLERSFTSRNRIACSEVAPIRNRILVYPDSDEEYEEYCSLPPLLLCFQTPQPCNKFNSISYNVENEIDIDNMTLKEYARYELALSRMKCEINNPTLGFTIGAKNIRKMEHEVPNRCDDNTHYEDSDQEDGELPNLPTFSVTNKFSSVCIQIEEIIDVNTARELEESFMLMFRYTNSP
ncbi:hypothetical protein Tco_1447834 [Tanacetum coccineum]